MRTDELAALRHDLNVDEDNREFPYDDATGKTFKPGDTLKGNLTVGVGYNLTSRPLSVRVRNLMLDECIDECLVDLMTFPWFLRLDGVRQRALVDFRFNVGRAKFRTFPKFIAAMAAGDHDGAAWELSASKWARQVQPARKARLIHMVKTGTVLALVTAKA